MFDEIQTGLGRTGKLFAYQHEDAKPDILILGKALGGGVYPVSAILTANDVMEVFTPGDHGSTFGGNPLASAAGEAALQVLQEERLTDRAQEMGQYFMAGLKKNQKPKGERGTGGQGTVNRCRNQRRIRYRPALLRKIDDLGIALQGNPSPDH